jgi:hypothetical protein
MRGLRRLLRDPATEELRSAFSKPDPYVFEGVENPFMLSGSMIENEWKYVLETTDAIHEALSRYLTQEEVTYSDILQGYVALDGDRDLRIRHSKTPKGESFFRMEFKVRLEDGTNLEPPSMPITPETFERLWPLSRVQVSKRRYLIDGIEIDFFYRTKIDEFAIPPRKWRDVYLVLAEIERSEGEGESALPEWFEGLVRYRVKQGDPRFFNFNLGDPETVRLLVRCKKCGKEDGELRRCDGCGLLFCRACHDKMEGCPYADTLTPQASFQSVEVN